MAKRKGFKVRSFVTFPDGTHALLTERMEDGTMIHHEDALTPEEWECFRTFMAYQVFQAEKEFYFKTYGIVVSSTDEWTQRPPAPVGRFARKPAAEAAD